MLQFSLCSYADMTLCCLCFPSYIVLGLHVCLILSTMLFKTVISSNILIKMSNSASLSLMRTNAFLTSSSAVGLAVMPAHLFIWNCIARSLVVFVVSSDSMMASMFTSTLLYCGLSILLPCIGLPLVTALVQLYYMYMYLYVYIHGQQVSDSDVIVYHVHSMHYFPCTQCTCI